jgi:hypothetical protein
MKRRSFFGVLVAPFVAVAVVLVPKRKAQSVEINKGLPKSGAERWQVKVETGPSHRSGRQIERDVIFDAMQLCGLTDRGEMPTREDFEFGDRLLGMCPYPDAGVRYKTAWLAAELADMYCLPSRVDLRSLLATERIFRPGKIGQTINVRKPLRYTWLGKTA